MSPSWLRLMNLPTAPCKHGALYFDCKGNLNPFFPFSTIRTDPSFNFTDIWPPCRRLLHIIFTFKADTIHSSLVFFVYVHGWVFGLWHWFLQLVLVKTALNNGKKEKNLSANTSSSLQQNQLQLITTSACLYTVVTRKHIFEGVRKLNSVNTLRDAIVNSPCDTFDIIMWTWNATVTEARSTDFKHQTLLFWTFMVLHLDMLQIKTML